MLLSIKNLSKHFGDLEVLKDVNMDVEAGEVVVIIGPSGSGKSTLLRCINQLEEPTGGSIFYEGQDLVIIVPAFVISKVPITSSEIPA